ncbi:benzoate 4-monooxygenase cytochrome P450 [Xylogone sp. PMI_703]|nr:benzoate 4-monooxygenase cytochrome P450 [Xylogone sp. PMI_703]
MGNLYHRSFLIIYFIIKPLVEYFFDAKGLRKYPNQNILSGITNLGYIWERTRGFRTKNLYEKHKIHPVIRLGPNTLSFADVRAIRDIYGHSTKCRKDDMYTVTAGPHVNLLDVVDKDDHARKRRMLSNAFATRNLEGWEFKVHDKVKNLIVQFDRFCTKPLSDDEQPQTEDLTIDFRKWANLFTVDAIADIGLSESLGMLINGNDKLTVDVKNGHKQSFSFIESLHGGNRASSIVGWATGWFHIIRPVTDLASRYFNQQWQHGRNYSKIVSHLTRRRLEKHQSGENLDDFLACLIEDKQGKPRQLDQGEIEAEVNVLMNAGSDTTAIALANVLYYLVKNPSKLTKLREEVAPVFSDGSSIAPYSKVKNLPYLKACLDESLRITPPVSFGLLRRTPPEGAMIHDQFVPGNTVVSVAAYVAHRDPTIFPQPDEYRPERWIEDEEKAKEMRNYFIPFSTGARGCIGRNISYLEQHVLIATLVHRYDFALPNKSWTLDWEEAFNMWPSSIPLKVWRRCTETTAS